MADFDEIVGFLADQTSGALRDAAQIAGKGDADFIRTGEPVSIYGRIVQGAARQACRRYGENPSGVRAGARAKAEEACRGYLDDIGFISSPSIGVPFQGGQCSVPYIVSYSTFQLDSRFCSDPNIPQIQTINGGDFSPPLMGPILGLQSFIDTPGQCGDRRIGVRVTTAAGVQTFVVTQTGNNIRVASAPVVYSLRRQDGLPDNCGNIPPTVTEPAPLPPGPGSERFNPAPDIDLTIGVEVNPDGTIAVDFGAGDITIDPWGDGGGNAPTPPAPGDETVGEGTGQGGGDNDFGDPPPGERWVGCEVRITQEPPGVGRIPQSVPRDIYYAIEGNARLKFNSPSGVGYDTPIPIRSKTTFLWESVRGLNPSGVFVNLRPGFSYTVKPYSVAMEN